MAYALRGLTMLGLGVVIGHYPCPAPGHITARTLPPSEEGILRVDKGLQGE
jgi:hypothetical protein